MTQFVIVSTFISNHFQTNKRLRSCLVLMFMRTVIKNIKNIIFMFFKNYSCFLNLMFVIFSVFFIKKKKKI